MRVIDAVLGRLRKIASWGINRLRGSRGRRLAEAKSYVSTDKVSGQLQYELLKREGCMPTSKVLELGCGCLHLGIPLVRYLDKGNYVGIDPAEWLRQRTMEQRRVRHLVEGKQARFLSVDDFDASALGIMFDYVFSHSVLSHCAHWQLQQFLQNVSKVLAPKGRVLASVRLAEGNAYGSPGTPDKKDSMDEQWQYPGVSWFTLSAVIQMAESQGLTVRPMPAYTEFYTKSRPEECHDWLVFSWKARE